MSTAPDDLRSLQLLGLALGILVDDDAGPRLNDDWLANPQRSLASILRDPVQRDAAIAFATQMLGQGDAPIGAGIDDDASWIPVARRAGSTSTGLFVVAERPGGETGPLRLSVAARFGGESGDGSTRASGVVRVPLAGLDPQVGGTSTPPRLLLGTDDGAIDVSVNVRLPSNPRGATIRDASFSALVPTTEGADPALLVSLRGVRFPGSEEEHDLVVDPRDADLADAAELLLSLVGAADEEDALLGSVLTFLGVRPGGSMPPIDPQRLVQAGAAAIAERLDGALADAGGRRELVAILARALGVDGGDVNGAGTGADPFVLPVVSGVEGEVEVTLAIERDPASGSMRCEPGIRWRWRSGDGWLVGEAGLFSLRPGDESSFVPLPSLRVAARAGTPGETLLETSVDGTGLLVGHLDVGLALDSPTRPALVFEAHDVALGDLEYPRVDLTSVDLVATLGGAAGAAISGSLIDALGEGAVGTAFAVAAGVITPPDVEPSEWVDLVPAGELLTDASGALARFQARAFADADVAATIVGMAASIVGGAADRVEGNGTEPDPWRVPLAVALADRSPELVVWRDDARVHAAIRIDPAVDLDGARVTVLGSLELVSLALSEDGMDGGFGLDWGGRSELGIRVAGPLEIGPADDGVRVGGIDLDLSWEGTQACVASLSVTDTVIAFDGEETAFPPITLRSDGTLEPRGLPDGAWDAVARLFGARLASTDDPALRHLAALLGWMEGGSEVRVSDLGSVVPLEAADLPRLAVGDLVADPASALSGWLESVLGSVPATLHAASRVAAIANRIDFDAETLELDLGNAIDQAIARIALGSEGVASIGVVTNASLGAAALGELRDGLSGGGGTLDAAVRALEVAARFAPDLHRLLDRRDLPELLEALRGSLAGSDGLVPSAAQVPSGWESAAITAGHLGAAAATRLDEIVTDAPPPEGRLFVACDLPGLEPWPEQRPDRVLDLSGGPADPDSVDLSRLPERGPWFVVVPRRGVGGSGPNVTIDDQTALLRRVVDALDDRLPPERTIALVAHSVAGFAARAVAAEAASVSHLLTVATPHGPANLERLSDATTQDALALVRALLQRAPSGDDVDGALLRELVAGASRAGDAAGRPAAGSVADEFLAPAETPDVPHARTIAVVASAEAQAIDAGFRALIEGTLGGVLATVEDVAAPDRMGVDLAFPLDLPDVGELSLTGEIRIVAEDLVARGGTAPAPPSIAIHLGVHGRAGWVLPLGEPAAPALRAAELDVRIDEGPGRCTLRLSDAHLSGIHRSEVEVDLSDAATATAFDAHARAILGAVASAVGAIGPDGPGRALADLGEALGLVSINGGRPVPSADGIERFLAAPGNVLREASADLPALLAALLPASRGVDGTRIAGNDDLSLSIVLDHGSFGLRLATGEEGVDVASIALARCDLLCRPGSLRGSISLAPSGERPLGPMTLRIGLEGASPPQVHLDAAGVVTQLAPTPDREGLARLAITHAAGAFASTAIDELRRRARTRVDPLLSWVGLLPDVDAETASGNVQRLVTSVGNWFSTQEVVGGATSAVRIRDLVDAFRVLLDLEGGTGRIDLPWDLEVASEEGAGGAAILSVARRDPADGADVVATGSLRLAIAPGSAPAPELRVAIRATDVGDGFDAIGLDASLGSQREASITLDAGGGTDIVIPLLPVSPVSGLGEAGARAVLPLVLNALASHDTIGARVGAFGDALHLRSNDRFDADLLRAAAVDPAEHLGEVLAASTTRRALLEALDRLLGGIVGEARVALEDGADALRLGLNDDIAIVLGGDSTTRLDLDVGTIDHSGLRISGRVGVTAGTSPGLESLDVSFGVSDPTLVSLGGTVFLPAVTIRTTPGSSIGEIAIAGSVDEGSDALVIRSGEGPTRIVFRDGSGSESDDPAIVCAGAARLWLVPQAADLVLSLEAVRALLGRSVAAIGKSTEDLLLGAGVLTTRSPELAFVPDVLASPLPALIRLGVEVASALQPIAIADGLTLRPASETRDGRRSVGVRLDVDGRVPISSPGDLSIELETETGWIESDPPDPGLSLLLLSIDEAGGGDEIQLEPSLRAGGLGARIGGAEGAKLFDLGVSVRSIALHGVIEAGAHLGSDFEIVRSGGHVTVNELALPIGRAEGGENPVANKVLGQSRESGTELAPVLNPELIVWSDPPSVDLRLGPGSPPWWLPVQRSFGPLYVEQVGVNTMYTGEGEDRHLTFVTILLDGGVEIGGLTLGVDDLALTVPAASPFDPGTWSVDLAGLAVGYDSSGVNIAGGLRRIQSPGGIEYSGMLEVRFADFGLVAVGSYGEFPRPPSPGEGPQTYTSFFVFGAVDQPLGGPPAFFVMGLGAGIGLNRRLILPADVAQVTSHTLVRAMDTSSGFAEDPMSALSRMGSDFPPEPGTFWLAVGVRFTSFVLVESVAVISAQVGGDGLEIGLLGLSRMELPSRDFVMARLELALRARFSTREAVLGVQGQLTDNSWLIDPSCRLTGGFAFYVWFDEGDFVLTLGGYHPRFQKPARYPDVPRLGFDWHVSDAVAIKGDSYFAITASCVMAGGSLEVSYDAGIAWAAFRMGWNALIAWDPFYYDFDVYVSVSAGVKIRVCAPFGLGCATISISLSIGASVRIWGPELRGEANLDLDVTSVTVAFGSSDDPNRRDELTWTAFHQKYLVAGDPDGATMAMTVTHGFVPIDVADGQRPGTGSEAEPWKVVPEFGFVTQTRAASNRVFVGTVEHPFTGEAIDLGPMAKTDVASEHRVTVSSDVGVVAGLESAPVTANVPEATWGIVHADDPPAARVRPAFVGSSVLARANIDELQKVIALRDEEEEGELVHPLPFRTEFEDRPAFEEHAEAARVYGAEQPTSTGEILASAQRKLFALRDPLARVAYAREVAAPPRIAALSEGLSPPIPVPVPTTPAPPPPPPDPFDPKVGAPRLDAVLRLAPAATGASARTTVSSAPDLERIAPPTLAQIQAADLPLATRLSTRARPAVAVDQTVGSVGRPVSTALAGGIREARRSILSSDATSATLRTIEGNLLGGVTLLAGNLFVIGLDNAARDQDPDRPVIVAEGDQVVRVVLVDRAGEVLADREGPSLEVVVPPGTFRVLLAGRGTAAGEGATGTAGWHVDGQVVQLMSDVYVGAGTVARSTSLETKRDRRVVTTSIVTGASVVAGAGVIETTLPSQTTALVVGLELVGTEGPLRDVALTLSGASRPSAGEGPVEPAIVRTGNRAHVIFPIRADDGADVVAATVAVGPSWTLVGVAGSPAPVSEVARVLAERGIDDVVPPFVSGSGGVSRVTWRGGGA